MTPPAAVIDSSTLPRLCGGLPPTPVGSAGRGLIDLVAINGELGRRGGAGPAAEGHNLDHVCLRIEPFDEGALRAHLRRHGLQIGPLHHTFGAEGVGPALYLKDPEGNSIELKGPSQS